jgi:hypothetical protein
MMPFIQVAGAEISENSAASVFKGAEYESTLRLEAGHSSKTLVRIFQTIRRHVREESNLYCRRRQDTQTSRAKNQLTAPTNNVIRVQQP